jgi:glycosyltransferase involved in cell wall biosynthesis
VRKVSVIIPTCNERFLPETVADVFAKAAGEVEVIVVEEGYYSGLRDRPGLVVLHNETRQGMRQAINRALDAATGKYVMKLDAHCMMGEGWDETLKADCEEDWIVIPRRFSLDPEAWCIRTHRPTIDYEFIHFPYADEGNSVRQGGKWYERAAARLDVPFDNDMCFQGSCYFTRRDYLQRLGGLQTEGYGGFILESEELSFKAWLSGGQVKVNKKTWYAHLHKGKQFGRGYFINKWEMKRGRKYHIDYWMHNRWPGQTRTVEWLVNFFWPVPTWPDDWMDPKYEAEYWARMGVAV